MTMYRYWVVASSRNDPFHRFDGAVVLASEEGATPRCYLMDLTRPNTSLEIPRHKLARWHPRDDRHPHCYCGRRP